ncbi:MAG: hotdog fold thioesterase [Desulfobacterales bacterium]|jgi:uncharacterized protein (TIGR00369 family)|nr:hotdog fold thioesterase [Desulfobacterales bacterium]
MQILTHNHIDIKLCGQPLSVEDGTSRVELQTNDFMAVDAHGLVHGGFIFGLADHAAMIAVNDPNVVLGSAQVKFIRPVRAGQSVVAEAATLNVEGKKHSVSVIAFIGDTKVFEGEFKCFVLEKHVLA